MLGVDGRVIPETIYNACNALKLRFKAMFGSACKLCSQILFTLGFLFSCYIERATTKSGGK